MVKKVPNFAIYFSSFYQITGIVKFITKSKKCVFCNFLTQNDLSIFTPHFLLVVQPLNYKLYSPTAPTVCGFIVQSLDYIILGKTQNFFHFFKTRNPYCPNEYKVYSSTFGLQDFVTFLGS